MAEILFARGRVVSRDENAWKMERDGDVREGTTRKVWIASGSGAPTEVSFRDDESGIALLELIESAGEFAMVEVGCEVSANKNDRGDVRLTKRVVSIERLATIDGEKVWPQGGELEPVG